MTAQDAFAALQERKAKYAAMSPFNVVKALEKTAASINGQIDRCGPSLGSKRAQELVDRYDDLRVSLRSGPKGDARWQAWDAYCDKFGASRSHNAYDLFA